MESRREAGDAGDGQGSEVDPMIAVVNAEIEAETAQMEMELLAQDLQKLEEMEKIASIRTPVDPELDLIDPNPDLTSLFVEFDREYFWRKLTNSSVTVGWSRRMTRAAGYCCYSKVTGLCEIRLSEPLLKLRPRSDLVQTLLHEMIHAYLFVTENTRDRDGHGPNFVSHMKRINETAGTNITIYHNFLEEVNLYKVHWWRCDGPCKLRPPYFGFVRRCMNRPPGPIDNWWSNHLISCGGTFQKVKEPEKKTKGSNGKQKAPEGQDIRKMMNSTASSTSSSGSKTDRTATDVGASGQNCPGNDVGQASVKNRFPGGGQRLGGGNGESRLLNLYGKATNGSPKDRERKLPSPVKKGAVGSQQSTPQRELRNRDILDMFRKGGSKPRADGDMGRSVGRRIIAGVDSPLFAEINTMVRLGVGGFNFTPRKRHVTDENDGKVTAYSGDDSSPCGSKVFILKDGNNSAVSTSARKVPFSTYVSNASPSARGNGVVPKTGTGVTAPTTGEILIPVIDETLIPSGNGFTESPARIGGKVPFSTYVSNASPFTNGNGVFPKTGMEVTASTSGEILIPSGNGFTESPATSGDTLPFSTVDSNASPFASGHEVFPATGTEVTAPTSGEILIPSGNGFTGSPATSAERGGLPTGGSPASASGNAADSVRNDSEVGSSTSGGRICPFGSAPSSGDSTTTSTANFVQVEDEPVTCPICGSRMLYSAVNNHIDTCTL